MPTAKRKARKVDWGAPLNCRPGKSSWIKANERSPGPRREDRRRIRQANRRRLRRGSDDFVPYRRGVHFTSHPDW